MRMKNYIVVAVFSALVFMGSAQNIFAQSEGIAVVVNEDAITVSDVNDRMRLIMLSAGFPDTEEVKQKVAPQIINSLVEEQIKFQEAERLEIQVSPEEIAEGFAQLSKQNNMEPEQFKALLAQAKVNIATMERQIASQLAWGKVIQKKFRPRITISDSDIDAFLERLKNNIGKQEYLAAEIFLPVESPEQEDEVRNFANNLAAQVTDKKAPFFKLAQQFSRAPGAAQGGDLGWVQSGQLDQELEITLANLEKNSVSIPVRTQRGYHLLFLREVRSIAEENIPPREDVENMLGTQRLERAQARHMLDLKSSAFIDSRV